MNNFASNVQEYFRIYLPITRNLSNNTISTYSYSMIVFIKFLESKDINTLELKSTDITYDLILEFITWLKCERNNSATTINLRITAIKTFFEFIELKDLAMYEECVKINKIKLLKTDKHIPSYLTIEEITLLLNIIDINSRNGLKELAILSLLFDAGLRVSELCNIKIGDLDFDNNTSPKVTIIKSKGNKTRTVSINKDVVKIIKKYLETREFIENDSYLFLNKYGNHYTRSGIDKIFKKHYNNAKNNCQDTTMFRNKPHCHMLRHSKGMQLAESNTNIIVIRNFLGHSSVTTTEIYARISADKQDKIIMENVKTKPLHKYRSKKEEQSLESWLLENLPK